jgi:hypothetical protein
MGKSARQDLTGARAGLMMMMTSAVYDTGRCFCRTDVDLPGSQQSFRRSQAHAAHCAAPSWDSKPGRAVPPYSAGPQKASRTAQAEVFLLARLNAYEGTDASALKNKQKWQP